MTNLLIQHGLVILFVLIAVESAGVPLPGETALITAGILSSQGHYRIEWVIVVAAAAAIVGDNIGYWIGRLGGRRLLERWQPIERHARKVLPPAERFFARHGGKTVFIGRFIAFLRFTAAWIAGITHMTWWRFLAWNALGGIVWASAVGIVAYEFGHHAAEAINRYGVYAAAVIVVAVALGFVGLRIWRRRLERNLEEAG